MRLKKIVFSTNQNAYPNFCDIAALFVVLAIIIVLSITAKQMSSPFDLGEQVPIHLSAWYLPDYALRTVMRMFIAMGISLLMTFIFGTWAAKSRHAERIIIPMVDILQSVPILGFLSISVPTFIGLFPKSMLSPECAAIFAIITSQVWNMMLSMSAGWFFVVASEAISIAKQSIMLPGIGSYIAMAITQSDKVAIIYAILTMLAVIILYDQLLFRPLMSWSDKFRTDLEPNDHMAESWVVDIFLRSRWFKRLGSFLALLRDVVINIRLVPYREKNTAVVTQKKSIWFWLLTWITHIGVYVAILFVLFMLIQFIAREATWSDVLVVFGLGLATAVKIFLMIAGTTTLPKELLMASRLFGVCGWLKWKRVILPIIFPYYVTGAMAAAGGAWNASIVAEVLNWGGHRLHAFGLGAYISEMKYTGKPAQEALGIVVMCLLVVIINRFVWWPLYALAEGRFHIE